jgi:chorismate-pyruvate lyase
MRLVRLIKAIASEIRVEIMHQLWMASRNLHPDYLDFTEFRQDAGCYQREMLLTIKIQSMSDYEWEVYKQLHYK